MGYIAHTSEAFLDRSSGDVVGETDKRYWVGTTPRLAIRDGDAGYARMEAGVAFGDRVWVVAFLAPFTLRLPIYFDAQIRFWGGWNFPSSAVPIILGIQNETDGTYVAADRVDPPQTYELGVWHDISFEMEPRDEAELATAAAAGEVFVGILAHDDTTVAFDLSFLGLRGGARPLRWRQRNDGLGGSSPKAARGVTSQQGSNRHRGYL